MIRGIGIDSVEITRCIIWTSYTATHLSRIFSPHEISYSFEHKQSSAQRLAARFAVKEATYKALCGAYPQIRMPFLTLCKAIELIQHPHSAPQLVIQWPYLHDYHGALSPLACHVSVTHTDMYATAIVILET